MSEMSDASEGTQAAAGEAVQPTLVDAVTVPAMVPMDDAAGGPTADKEQEDEPSDEEAAAQLGDFA